MSLEEPFKVIKGTKYKDEGEHISGVEYDTDHKRQN
jgi:hypothetical protein